jgi:hypothetical protein
MYDIESLGRTLRKMLVLVKRFVLGELMLK